jgi:hypothetical protein
VAVDDGSGSVVVSWIAVEVSMAPSDWVVTEAVSIVVEEETSVDLELALQGLAAELDTKQLAMKAKTNVLGIIF